MKAAQQEIERLTKENKVLTQKATEAATFAGKLTADLQFWTEIAINVSQLKSLFKHESDNSIGAS